MEINVNFYAHTERKICTEPNDGPFLFLFFHTYKHNRIYSLVISVSMCACVYIYLGVYERCIRRWLAGSVIVVTRMMWLLGMLHQYICSGVVIIVDGSASASFRACALYIYLPLHIVCEPFTQWPTENLFRI